MKFIANPRARALSRRSRRKREKPLLKSAAGVLQDGINHYREIREKAITMIYQLTEGLPTQSCERTGLLAAADILLCDNPLPLPAYFEQLEADKIFDRSPLIQKLERCTRLRNDAVAMLTAAAECPGPSLLSPLAVDDIKKLLLCGKTTPVRPFWVQLDAAKKRLAGLTAAVCHF